LSGLNTYTGGTTIEGGSISVGQDLNLGASGAITLQGGELLTTGPTFSTLRAIVLSGAGPNTLAAATGTSATYNGALTGTALQVGDLTGNGNNGTVILRGGVMNTYSGVTSIVGGATLNVDTDAELGAGGGLTLDNGKLTTSGDLSGSFETARAIVLNAGGVTLAAPDTTIDRTATFDGGISGIGGLTIGDANGAGLTVILNNTDNNYSGGTTVTGGAILQIASDAELGLFNTGVTLAGGTLQTVTDGFVTFRPIALLAFGNIPSTLVSGFDATAFYNGAITGSGGLTIGGGVVVLNAVNTYFGGTTIQNAT
jgi:fibronectin-binding autotransporter adhesin